MIGEGNGVISVMAARYGEANMELVEAGECEDVMLLVERVDLSDEEAAAIGIGDEYAGRAASTGVSKMVGVWCGVAGRCRADEEVEDMSVSSCGSAVRAGFVVWYWRGLDDERDICIPCAMAASCKDATRAL